MAFDVKKLRSRCLSKSESETVMRNINALEAVTWYIDQMWVCDSADPDNPEKRHRPEVGEGIEVGPFEFENDAKNFHSYYSLKVAKALGWGAAADGKPGPTLRTKGKVIQREGKWWLWVVRRS